MGCEEEERQQEEEGGKSREGQAETLSLLCLRYQVLFAFFAGGELRLRAWDVDVAGVGTLVQNVLEGVQVIRLQRTAGEGERQRQKDI